MQKKYASLLKSLSSGKSLTAKELHNKIKTKNKNLSLNDLYKMLLQLRNAGIILIDASHLTADDIANRVDYAESVEKSEDKAFKFKLAP